VVDTAQKATARRWFNRLCFVAGVTLLIFMISRFPLSDIADACVDLGPVVFVTPLICLGWFAASSSALFALLDRDVPWWALAWNRFVGEGYNAIIPAAGVGGEPFKLRQLTRYVSMRRAVVALINDRLLENAIALAFSATCVGIGATTLEMDAALRTTMLTYTVIAGTVAIVVSVLLLANLTGRIGTRIAKWLGSSDLGSTRLAKPILARAFVWTALARTLSLFEIALLFWLLDLPVTFTNVVFTGGALSAAGFVGGVIPQGLGVAEAASVGIFELLHFPGAAAVAFALARRGRTLIVSVAGVSAHLINLRLRRLREVHDHVGAAPQPAEQAIDGQDGERGGAGDQPADAQERERQLQRQPEQTDLVANG
jgi:hypothetical protein